MKRQQFEIFVNIINFFTVQLSCLLKKKCIRIIFIVRHVYTTISAIRNKQLSFKNFAILQKKHITTHYHQKWPDNLIMQLTYVRLDHTNCTLFTWKRQNPLHNHRSSDRSIIRIYREILASINFSDQRVSIAKND